MQSSNKWKWSDGTTVLNAQIETCIEPFIEFPSKVIDILDENNINGYYLVMDNAPIHTNQLIIQIVEQCGYKCTYLALYSSFLNPIEEF